MGLSRGKGDSDSFFSLGRCGIQQAGRREKCGPDMIETLSAAKGFSKPPTSLSAARLPFCFHEHCQLIALANCHNINAMLSCKSPTWDHESFGLKVSANGVYHVILCQHSRPEHLD